MLILLNDLHLDLLESICKPVHLFLNQNIKHIAINYFIFKNPAAKIVTYIVEVK